MRHAAYPLPPSCSLPPLRTLEQLSETEITSALQSLSTIYCSLPVSVAFQLNPEHKTTHHAAAAAAVVDSGYVSETDDDHEEIDGIDHHMAALRVDTFERKVAQRWLTGFMARAETLSCFESEEACQLALDQASCVLESFFAPPPPQDGDTDDDDNDDAKDEKKAADQDYARDFAFDLVLPGTETRCVPVTVRLNDRLAGTNSADPDDVGLQSWGASIVLSHLMCTDPARFGLAQPSLGPSPRIVELGAGTGLVSLALGNMLPHLGASKATIVATDYHPAVLANLKANVKLNFPSYLEKEVEVESSPIRTAPLNWSVPVLQDPLDVPVDIMIATDVIYAPTHATWLRDCATQLLAADGVFWLLVTVRRNGKFNGVSDTVEAAFAANDRPVGRNGQKLAILCNEVIEKRNGVGRGDESGYKLLRIGWTIDQ